MSARTLWTSEPTAHQPDLARSLCRSNKQSCQVLAVALCACLQSFRSGASSDKYKRAIAEVVQGPRKVCLRATPCHGQAVTAQVNIYFPPRCLRLLMCWWPSRRSQWDETSRPGRCVLLSACWLPRSPSLSLWWPRLVHQQVHCCHCCCSSYSQPFSQPHAKDRAASSHASRPARRQHLVCNAKAL